MNLTDSYKVKALVVGVDDYEHANKLVNAVNDAKGMAKAFYRLKFYVDQYYDITADDWANGFFEFRKDLDQFQVCIIYFAGHGVEIGGENFLICKDAKASNPDILKKHSIKLQEVLDELGKSQCPTNILIADACRNNPFGEGRAAFASSKLAPMFAPQGTLIAFSTSPGETASDGGGTDNHSIYTSALLKYINELGLPVESFFKKVRATVYNLSQGHQTSWEHTSLIGNFSFNSGQLVQDLYVGDYIDWAICREKYDYSDPAISDIVRGFMSTQFDEQREALRKMKTLSLNCLDKNQQFLLGRCCMWAAQYNCFDCQHYFEDRNNLSDFTKNGINNFLNGVLYEQYFNGKGVLWDTSVNISMLERVLKYRTDVKLKSSFEYIHQVLAPFRHFLLFVPSPNPEPVSIDVTLEEAHYSWVDGTNECLAITSIRHNVVDLMESYSRNWVGSYNNAEALRADISKVCHIPLEFVKVNMNKTPINKMLILVNAPIFNVEIA